MSWYGRLKFSQSEEGNYDYWPGSRPIKDVNQYVTTNPVNLYRKEAPDATKGVSHLRGKYYSLSEQGVNDALAFVPVASEWQLQKIKAQMKNPLVIRDEMDLVPLLNQQQAAILRETDPQLYGFEDLNDSQRARLGMNDLPPGSDTTVVIEILAAREAKRRGHDYIFMTDRGGGSPGGGWPEVVDLSHIK